MNQKLLHVTKHNDWKYVTIVSIVGFSMKSYWFLRFSILITHAYLLGILLSGRIGNSMIMISFMYMDHFRGSFTPSIVTLVVAVGTGRPSRILLSSGHPDVTIPYTAVPFACFFVVYLK